MNETMEDLRQQLAEALAEVEKLNRQSTPYRNRDSGYIRLVPHGEDVVAWLDNGCWEKVDGWGELGPLQNLQTSISILTNNLREFVGDITGSVPPITQPSHANFFVAGVAVQELKEQLAAQAAELERMRKENARLDADRFWIGSDTLADLIADPDLRDDIHAAMLELRDKQQELANCEIREEHFRLSYDNKVHQLTQVLAMQVDYIDQLSNAATLIRRLTYQLNKVSPGLMLCEQASDWLKRKGLQGSILREDE